MIKLIKRCAAAAALITLLAGGASADVTVKAPSEVKTGRPFLVRVEARGEKLSSVKVSWLGREAPLAAGADGCRGRSPERRSSPSSSARTAERRSASRTG